VRRRRRGQSDGAITGFLWIVLIGFVAGIATTLGAIVVLFIWGRIAAARSR